MNRQIVLSIAFVALFISCKKETPAQPNPTETPVVTKEVKETGPIKKCFLYEANGNKIELRIVYGDNDSMATGELNYFLKEKDSNKGMFTGKFENNILIADYTFQSEGTESTRQVAFQLKGNQFIEGYGEMNQDGTKFKDASKLTFDSKMPLSETACPE